MNMEIEEGGFGQIPGFARFEQAAETGYFKRLGYAHFAGLGDFVAATADQTDDLRVALDQLGRMSGPFLGGVLTFQQNPVITIDASKSGDGSLFIIFTRI